MTVIAKISCLCALCEIPRGANLAALSRLPFTAALVKGCHYDPRGGTWDQEEQGVGGLWPELALSLGPVQLSPQVGIVASLRSALDGGSGEKESGPQDSQLSVGRTSRWTTRRHARRHNPLSHPCAEPGAAPGAGGTRMSSRHTDTAGPASMPPSLRPSSRPTRFLRPGISRDPGLEGPREVVRRFAQSEAEQVHSGQGDPSGSQMSGVQRARVTSREAGKGPAFGVGAADAPARSKRRLPGGRPSGQTGRSESVSDLPCAERRNPGARRLAAKPGKERRPQTGRLPTRGDFTCI